MQRGGFCTVPRITFMNDQRKTKNELLRELTELRRRLAAMEEATAERQRLEDGLRQLRNFLRGVIEAIPEVTIVVDRDFRVILANKAARDRVGGEDPVSAGYKCYEVSRHRALPCDAEQEPCPLALVLETGTPVTVSHTHVNANGQEVIVEVSAAPIFDETGAVARIVESCCDITERVRAEQALRQERDFAASVIETAHAVVLVLDPEGRVVQFNAFTERLTGYQLDEVRGTDWCSRFVPPHDRVRVRALLQQPLLDFQPCEHVSRLVTHHGLEREIAWFTKALKGPQHRIVGLLSIGHDITALRDAQEQLVQAERLAAIGEAMTGLAHESRNALQRSQACLEMLASRVEDRPEALDLIARIQAAQDHLHHLYEEVREYAAPLVLRPELQDLRQLLQEAWGLTAALREGRQVRLRETGTEADTQCYVDGFAVQQVFRNIFENALDAGRDPLEIDVVFAAVEHETQPAVCVAIRDNGPGLTPEQLRRIFDSFYTTKTHGTGLGMAIAKRVIEAHGGRIEARSLSGTGAELLLTLPRRTT